MASLKEQDVTSAVVDACRRGDRDAFRVLYEAHKDKVYSIALYFFHGDAAMAADVTQQVFLKLLGSIRQKLFPLPDETIVYSGHGPETTIGHEKKYNP